MTPHDKTIAFQELNEVARALRARVAADPLQGACVALEAAINTLNGFDVNEEVIKQQGAKIEEQLRQIAKNDNTISNQRREITSNNDETQQSKRETEHWDRLAKDAQLKAITDIHVK